MSSSSHRRPLATPLRLAITAVAVLASALVALTLYISREANRVLSERTLTSLSSELISLRRIRDQNGSDALVRAIAERAQANATTLYQIASADGRVLAGNLGPGPKPGPEGGLFNYTLQREPNNLSRQAAGLTVAVGDGNHLTIARDIEDQRVLADTLRRATMFGIVGLTLLGLGFGWLMSRMLNQRLTTINTTASAIMAGDLSRRVDRDGSQDEIDTLSANLNVMLNRIEELMGALREVSDNIAHDLKTPLTRLRNRAEAALRDPSGNAAFRDGLERTIEEADGLIQTFNALLLIARLEAGAVEDTKLDTDVTALVSDVIELYQPVADEAGLKLIYNPGQPTHAAINRQLVGQAVANLIDNAIKYSKNTASLQSLSTIDVSVQAAPNGDAIIVVDDHGPGIPNSERGRVLKRFVRLEQSRSAPGTGLGLSLVAAVARLHDGMIRLEDNAPGLRVLMTLHGSKKHMA